MADRGTAESRERTRRLRGHLLDAVREMEAETPYYRKATHRYLETIEILGDLLPGAAPVAEIGPSPLAVALARSGIPTTVYGLYRSARERERLEAEGISIVDWNLVTEPLPSKPASFGLVLFLEVIEHLLLYPRDTLSRLLPLIAPEGRLLVSTPDLFRLKNKLKLVANRPLFGPVVETEDGGYHIRELSQPELVGHLRAVGLEPERTGRFGPIAPSRPAALLRAIRPVTTFFTTHFYVLAQRGTDG